MDTPQLPSRLAAAIRNYVGTLDRDRNRPVSVSRLVNAARSLMPDAAIGDAELVDLITRELVAAGANVDFDSGRLRPVAAAGFKPPPAKPAQTLIIREVMPLSMRRRRLRKGRATQL